MLREIGIVVCSLVIVGVMGGASAEQMHDGGLVRGSVVMGPACPGPELLDQQGCAPRPSQATVRVFALRGGGDATPVTTLMTDRDGRFRLALAPGVYRLVPVSPDGLSVGKPRNVTVTGGSSIEVQLVIDTGMR